MPSWPWQALPAHGQAGGSAGAPHHRDDDVPRDGHAVLSGAGGSGVERARLMRCPQCQQDNPAEARFCNGCGARFQLACPSCSHVNPSGSRFCNGCGTKLDEQIAAGAEPRFSSPESYTPKHLAEKILTSKAALEGERKHVTVLFADLKG